MVKAALFLCGLLLACQEGNWFPWANIVGVIMVGLAALGFALKGK